METTDYTKLSDEVLAISRIIKLRKGLSAEAEAKADNLCRDLDYSEYYQNRI